MDDKECARRIIDFFTRYYSIESIPNSKLLLLDKKDFDAAKILLSLNKEKKKKRDNNF